MVRRLKSELPKDDYGHDRFPKRVLEAAGGRLHGRGEAHPRRPEAVHRAAAGERAQDNAEKFATEFVLMTLKKRLFSSPAAFLRTLEQHETSLRTPKKRKGVSKPTLGILQRQIDRVEEEYSTTTRPRRRPTMPWTPPASCSVSRLGEEWRC